MAVHTHAQLGAPGDVVLARGPHVVSLKRYRRRVALNDAQRLADIEAELRVERQRAAVVRRLHKAHAGDPAVALTLERRLHKRSPGPGVHCLRLDGDRPDANDGRALVERSPVRGRIPVGHAPEVVAFEDTEEIDVVADEIGPPWDSMIVAWSESGL